MIHVGPFCFARLYPVPARACTWYLGLALSPTTVKNMFTWMRFISMLIWHLRICIRGMCCSEFVKDVLMSRRNTQYNLSWATHAKCRVSLRLTNETLLCPALQCIVGEDRSPSSGSKEKVACEIPLSKLECDDLSVKLRALPIESLFWYGITSAWSAYITYAWRLVVDFRRCGLQRCFGGRT